MDLFHMLAGSTMVAAGALCGTSARFFVSGIVAGRFGQTFPWGTLVVNVSGCVLMGMAAAFAAARGLTGDSLICVLVVTGFLGSYTTVSSFALQTLALLRDAQRGLAVRNILLSLVLCLGAVAGGYAAFTAVLAGALR